MLNLIFVILGLGGGILGLLLMLSSGSEVDLTIVLCFIILFAVGFYGLYFYMKEKWPKIKLPKKEILIGGGIVVAAIVLICFVVLVPAQRRSTVKDNLYQTAIEKGLEHVSIKITSAPKLGETGYYNIDLDCSNFDSFSPEEMLAIVDALEEESNPEELIDVRVLSNGNYYRVDPQFLLVMRNGETLLNNYKNSEFYEKYSNNESLPADACSRCSGTGYVTKHYGNTWSQEDGYGYGDVCGQCGGSGRA